MYHFRSVIFISLPVRPGGGGGGQQCCGSGIRCPFDPWVRDPGPGIRCPFDPWIRDPGPGIRILLTPGSGPGIRCPFDPLDPGSGALLTPWIRDG
jgi:hypothetical protein